MYIIVYITVYITVYIIVYITVYITVYIIVYITVRIRGNSHGSATIESSARMSQVSEVRYRARGTRRCPLTISPVDALLYIV